ncbi:acyl-protein thioesterase 1 [[Candida] jaroonii]|uniref:Acyl-protein thioesterase 1 n=1 Tax=[Candida] jaroonii TaxID=467808 RepID=A0ACA9Y8L2_9ASCO|nr:acyl-protein thioesterase 1 [[Candida] jaroonii]
MSAITRLSKEAKSAIIFLHGLGDSGQGWSWFPELLESSKLVDTSTINFVFPNAPIVPVTANGGMRMPAWFDIYEFGNTDAPKDIQGILKTCELVKELIKVQHEEYHIPLDKIILGGFSQGAAVSLTTAISSDLKLGGFIALSGFFTIQAKIDELFTPTNLSTPIFQGHGDQDPIINHKVGLQANEILKQKGFANAEFKTYPGLAHSASDEELVDVAKFIKKVLQ